VRILLTGAGGQLGRELQERLTGEELQAFDHNRLDVVDRDAARTAVEHIRPDWIINAAAYNDVDRAESEREAAFAVNARAPGYLAEAAAAAGAGLVHISTDYVFDGRKGSSYTEDDAPNPRGVYARSKYEGEQRVLGSGARACVLRTAWLYGRYGRNFVRTILAAAERGGPVRVVADQIGSPTAVADLADAITGLIRTETRGLFHVVNAGACSRYELALAVVRGRVEVVPITTAEAARPAPRPVNSSLISVRWPLQPLRPWRAALDAFLAASDG